MAGGGRRCQQPTPPCQLRYLYPRPLRELLHHPRDIDVMRGPRDLTAIGLDHERGTHDNRLAGGWTFHHRATVRPSPLDFSCAFAALHDLAGDDAPRLGERRLPLASVCGALLRREATFGSNLFSVPAGSVVTFPLFELAVVE